MYSLYFKIESKSYSILKIPTPKKVLQICDFLDIQT